jgi:hypothetical protein
VLTEVKAYSSWQSAPALLLDDNGRAETDLIQVRHIEGLNPVKASINSSPLAVIDGTSFTGSNVLSRNIVLTVRPNPDWSTWSYEALRRLIYSYFMPKSLTRLRFLSDDMVPVEIEGYVEDVSVNQFSSDPEMLVSIICPDPYFTAVDPEIIIGQSIHEEGDFETIEYDGNIDVGIQLKVSHVSGDPPSFIAIQIGDPAITHFMMEASVDSSMNLEMSSVPMHKYVRNINLDSGIITNLLSKVHIEEGSAWPTLQPGENHFHIITDQGVQDFQLTYFERFGGL